MRAVPRPGSTLGGVAIRSAVATDRDSMVFRGTLRSLGRPVTLTVIDPATASTAGDRARFLRAWRIAGSLDHPNVIPVYDAGEHGGMLFVVVADAGGADLSALLASKGPLEPGRVARLFAAAGGALDAAHAQGLEHAGLTAEHLIVTGEGEDEHAWVTGFHAPPPPETGSETRPDVRALARVLASTVGDDSSAAAMRAVAADALEPARAQQNLTGRDFGAAVLAAAPAQRREPPRSMVGSRLSLALAGSIVAVATVLAATMTVATERSADQAPAPALAREPVGVGTGPWGLALGGDYVWAANWADGTVARVDRRRQRLVGRPTRVGRRPVGVAFGEGGLWVASSWDDTVLRLDPVTGRASGPRVRVGDEPVAIAVGAGSVWVLNRLDGTVTQVSPRAMRAAGTPIVVGAGEPDGGSLAFAGGLLWVSEKREGTVTPIDPRTGRVIGQPVLVGREPEGLAGEADRRWVALSGDDTVVSVDARTGRVDAPAVRVGGVPFALATAANKVWVATLRGGIQRIEDGRAVRVGGTVPEEAYGIVAGADGVWVSDHRAGAVAPIALDGGDRG